MQLKQTRLLWSYSLVHVSYFYSVCDDPYEFKVRQEPVQTQLNINVGHVDRSDGRKTTLLVSPHYKSAVLQHVTHIVTVCLISMAANLLNIQILKLHNL